MIIIMKFILKKNFICILNFLYEYVLIFYEKKMILCFLLKKINSEFDNFGNN